MNVRDGRSEASGLAALRRSGLLDAASSQVFERAVQLACTMTGAPAAIIAFGDGLETHLGACCGVRADTLEAGWIAAYCGRSSLHSEALDVPLDKGLGAVVAAPLFVGGQSCGVLCVLAASLRALPAAQRDRIGELAALLSAQLDELVAAQARQLRAERAAAYDARRFKDLADSLPVFVWTATAEGVVDYFGRPLIEFTGVPEFELSRPGAWLEVLHPDDREPVVEVWSASVGNGQPYSTRFRIRRHDGVYRWFWVSALPVRDDSGAISIWYGCAADIDEEVRLEREARELAAQLTATFASIQDAFFALDDRGCVRAINAIARREFALGGRDVVGLPAWHAFPGLWRTRLAIECRTVMQHRRALRFEIFLDERGRWFEVGIFPSDGGVTVLLRDIDQRIRDEMTNMAEARALGMIAAGAELSSVLEHVVRGVEAAVPGVTGSILFYDAHQGTLHHGAAPGLPDDYNALVDGLAAGPRAGSCGTAAWSREPVIVSDTETDPRWEDYREVARRYGLRACWSTPVLDAAGEVMATFAMYYREVRLPSEEDREVIRRTVNLVAIAIGRSREQCALRASEERFRSVFRDAATGMAITAADGRFIDANEAYCRMLGYSVEELRELDFLAITHPDDHAANQVVYQELLRGERPAYVIEKRYLTKSGRLVWARVSTSVQREGGLPVRLVAVAEDVTVRYLAEDALRQQSALLAMASRMGQLGGWLVEVPSGRLVWSDEVRHILDVPASHVPDLAVDVPRLYSPDYRDAVAEAVRQCMEQGVPIDMQADVTTMSGRQLRVHILGEATRDESGNIVRVQGTFQNITEHYRLMQRLSESEARFRELAENIRDVFWMRDPVAAAVLYVSPAYEEIWGRKCSDLYANPLAWVDSILPEDREQVMHSFEQDPSKVYRNEYRIRRPDGTVRWIVDTGFPVFDGDGRVVRVTGVARDVTERRLAEEELRAALAQLARSNRELEDFAYVASHDLQEPLRKIKVFSDRLNERAHALAEEERDYLERMARAAERMQNLIFDLLEYSRVATRTQPMQQVSLERIVDEALADFDVSIEESGACIEREPLPQVVGDPSQLRQLVFNLIGNALKFRRAGVAPRIRITAHREKRAISLSISDNGIGIDPAHAERIFRPFQRLHGRDEYPGSGIGLAIVKKIADRHGASVLVEGRPGEGTTFSVRFEAPPPEETA